MTKAAAKYILEQGRRNMRITDESRLVKAFGYNPTTFVCKPLKEQNALLEEIFEQLPQWIANQD